ncbi:MAG TPA: biotin/lipoyl-containing protein [Polyangiales bacterium]
MGKHRFVIDGQSFDVDVVSYDAGSGSARVSVNGQTHEVVRVAAAAEPVARAAKSTPVVAPAARAAAPVARASSSELRAPMAGRVLHVATSPGQRVARGQALVVLDAMKMENSLAAPADGVVSEVAVAVGDTVMHGALLVRLAAS